MFVAANIQIQKAPLKAMPSRPSHSQGVTATTASPAEKVSVAIGRARWRGSPRSVRRSSHQAPTSAPPPIAPSSRPSPPGPGVEAVGDDRGELLDGRGERR